MNFRIAILALINLIGLTLTFSIFFLPAVAVAAFCDILIIGDIIKDYRKVKPPVVEEEDEIELIHDPEK